MRASTVAGSWIAIAVAAISFPLVFFSLAGYGSRLGPFGGH